VIVPRAPGPLVAPEDLALGSRDELDEMVRELFGDPIEENPGRLDAVLVIVGVAVMGWSLLFNHSTGLLVLGVIVLLLGLALPLSSARRKLAGRRAAERSKLLAAAGTPLDATHPSVINLVRAYDDLSAIAARSGRATSGEGLEAGHLAMTEVASLLQGRRPEVEEQVDYINIRATAIRRLERALSRKHDAGLIEGILRQPPGKRELRRESAVAIAREKLAEIDSEDSLDELTRATDRLEADNTNSAAAADGNRDDRA